MAFCFRIFRRFPKHGKDQTIELDELIITSLTGLEFRTFLGQASFGSLRGEAPTRRSLYTRESGTSGPQLSYCFSLRRSLKGSLSYEAQNGGPYGAIADLSWPGRTFHVTLASQEASNDRRGARNDAIAHVPGVKDPSKWP